MVNLGHLQYHRLHMVVVVVQINIDDNNNASAYSSVHHVNDRNRTGQAANQQAAPNLANAGTRRRATEITPGTRTRI